MKSLCLCAAMTHRNRGVKKAAYGQIFVHGYKNDKLYRLSLSDIYYFEVVDGVSFLYTQNEVFRAKEKLYESVSAKSYLFRCSKSMILNADKIDYVRPSVSGRFEAVLLNGEIVIVSRKYVSELKRLLESVIDKAYSSDLTKNLRRLSKMKDVLFWTRRFVMIYGIIMICTFSCVFFSTQHQNCL